ncbi:MAG: epoxyqueuosine reductase QueH [Actinobacteria bacterium]|nr:epoxyqueuosine reductase QueH [Actinomycetota bacterium]
MANYSTLKPKMLLHSCCATCAAYPVKMLKDNFDISLFYYNPNIFPEKEYYRRLDDIRTLADLTGITLITGQYDNGEWSKAIKHLADEPEGGRRCPLCFSFRLKKTAETAKEKGFDIFGTTLSISPHKDSKVIIGTGDFLASSIGIDFYGADLKKKDGFKKAMDLSREYSFYRQHYCGCKYSISPDKL